MKDAADIATAKQSMADVDAAKERVRKAVTTFGTSAADEGVELPLADGVLTTNLGFPVVVVCCKADCIKGEHGASAGGDADGADAPGVSLLSHLRFMSDSKWDLLQAYIRKFALQCEFTVFWLLLFVCRF